MQSSRSSADAVREISQSQMGLILICIWIWVMGYRWKRSVILGDTVIQQ